MSSIEPSKKTIKMLYVRFADDFVILLNSKKTFAVTIKDKIEQWLLENLKLTLSPTKTTITNLKCEASKFLGFSFSTYNKRKLSLNKFRELTKTAGWNIVIDIDEQRILDRLNVKKFTATAKNDKPIAKNPWVVLKD
jgi:Reverse transcriptase (RNA-dependent DNA polymerase)